MILQAVSVGGKKTTIEIEEGLVNVWLLAKHDVLLQNLPPLVCHALIKEHIERNITRRPDIPLTAQVRELMYRDITIKLNGKANSVIPVVKVRPSKTRNQLNRIVKEYFTVNSMEFDKKLTVGEMRKLEKYLLSFYKEPVQIHKKEFPNGVYKLIGVEYENERFEITFSDDFFFALFKGPEYHVQ